MVQKTVRIDTRLEEDLELLSKILNRSQNDILNLSLENLFVENKGWFRYTILVDGLYPFFEMGEKECTFSVAGVNVHVSYVRAGTAIKLEYSDDGRELGGTAGHEEYEFTDDEKLKDKLIELAELVDSEDPAVKKYLDSRINYDGK